MGESTTDKVPAKAEVELFQRGNAIDSSKTACRAAFCSDLGTDVLLTGPAVPNVSLLSLLNNNLFGQAPVPNFNFATIRSLAIGREARYSHLLDKLLLENATSVLSLRKESLGAHGGGQRGGSNGAVHNCQAGRAQRDLKPDASCSLLFQAI